MDSIETTAVHPDALKVFRKLINLDDRFPSDFEFNRITYESRLDEVIKNCGSPIEQMLAVAIAVLKPDFMHVENQLELIWYKSLADQSERVYRPDFVVGFDWRLIIPEWEYASRGNWWDSGNEAYPWLPFFAVECDGRDYHNHHDAIERDKQRDRIFATRGMPVLRFTGSEIFNNVTSCAEQVVDLFKTNLRDRLKPGVWAEELISHGTKRLVLGKKWWE